LQEVIPTVIQNIINYYQVITGMSASEYTDTCPNNDLMFMPKHVALKLNDTFNEKSLFRRQ
jgi:hypothetical protein